MQLRPDPTPAGGQQARADAWRDHRARKRTTRTERSISTVHRHNAPGDLTPHAGLKPFMRGIPSVFAPRSVGDGDGTTDDGRRRAVYSPPRALDHPTTVNRQDSSIGNGPSDDLSLVFDRVALLPAGAWGVAACTVRRSACTVSSSIYCRLLFPISVYCHVFL
jgi:hypothetical protein